MTRQHIRLKEFDHNITKVHVPTEAYLLGAPLLDKQRAYCQHTDNEGFIKTGNYFHCDYTIAIVGDSFVENIFVDESYRFESILERKLLMAGRRVRVINAGVSGMTGLSAFNLILNKLIRIKPDLILFVQPSNDFVALLYEDGYFNDSNRFTNLVPPKDTQKPVFETINEKKEQIYNNIVLMSKLCELYGIKLIIATCAANSSKRQLAMMNDIIREQASNLCYQMIDLDKILAKDSRYYYDRCHLNKKGSENLADLLLRFICEKCYLDSVPLNNFQLEDRLIADLIHENNSYSATLPLTGVDHRVEAWLSFTTRPKNLEVPYSLLDFTIELVSDDNKFKYNVASPSSKILQQTIDLNRCVPGVYKLNVTANQGLPFVFEDVRAFSLVVKD